MRGAISPICCRVLTQPAVAGASNSRKRKQVSSETPTATLVADIPEELWDVLYLDSEVQQLQQAKRRKYKGTDQARVLTTADFISERKTADSASGEKKEKKAFAAARRAASKADTDASKEGKSAKPDAKQSRRFARRTVKPSPTSASEDDESSSGGSDSDVLVVRSDSRKSALMIDDGASLCVVLRGVAWRVSLTSLFVLQGTVLSLSSPTRSLAGRLLRSLTSMGDISPPATTVRATRTRFVVLSNLGSTMTARGTSRSSSARRFFARLSLLPATARCRLAPWKRFSVLWLLSTLPIPARATLPLIQARALLRVRVQALRMAAAAAAAVAVA